MELVLIHPNACETQPSALRILQLSLSFPDLWLALDIIAQIYGLWAADSGCRLIPPKNYIQKFMIVINWLPSHRC